MDRQQVYWCDFAVITDALHDLSPVEALTAGTIFGGIAAWVCLRCIRLLVLRAHCAWLLGLPPLMGGHFPDMDEASNLGFRQRMESYQAVIGQHCTWLLLSIPLYIQVTQAPAVLLQLIVLELALHSSNKQFIATKRAVLG